MSGCQNVDESGESNSSSCLHSNNMCVFVTQSQRYGVSGHTVGPRELQQDGSPFTEGGGMGGGVKGWVFATVDVQAHVPDLRRI